MTRNSSLFQNLNTLLRFSKYCSPILRNQSSILSLSFLSLFGQILFQILQPWPLKFVIDRIVSYNRLEGPEIFQIIESLDTTTLLIFSAIAFILIAGMKALSSYSTTVGFATVGNRLLTQIRNMLYRHIQYLSLSFHTKMRSGDLLLRVMNDVTMLKEVSVTAFLPLIGNIFALVGMFAVMFWLNWQLALLSTVVIPLFFFSAIKKSDKIHSLARKQRSRESVMASTVSESIGAIKDIQAMSLTDIFFNAFSSQSNKTLNQDVKVRKLQASIERTVDVLIAVATALVLWYGATLVIGNELTPGELLVFLSYLGTAFRPLRNFAKYSGRIAKASSACERVLEILETKQDVYDTPDAIEVKHYNGHIQFKDVKFEYELGKVVLDNINFEIKAGERIAIVGLSGSGKSTLVNLILRLYDCTEGSIFIDGRNIRDYKLFSHRNQISVVLQDNVLFASTIKENIAYGGIDVTEQDVKDAAILAKADEFIMSLPNGYDTIIGERGVTLSKGQRQRIAIARAAIRKKPIIILDEPTTGLDKQNELQVIAALNDLTKGKTTFLITHDLEHASQMDKILYLENGKLIEYGKHKDLINNNNGKYSFLYKIQNENLR
ncbi:MAG: ABC transporter ATP-binding protein [Nitrososphaeraceae archaeon]